MLNTFKRLILVIQHAYAMWKVLNLSKNRQKGSWLSLEHYHLYFLAEKELVELKSALWDWDTGTGSIARVESEAADVSAFMAMIVDKVRRTP